MIVTRCYWRLFKDPFVIHNANNQNMLTCWKSSVIKRVWLNTFLVFIIRTIAASTCNKSSNNIYIWISSFKWDSFLFCSFILFFSSVYVERENVRVKQKWTWYWRSWNTLSVVLVFSSTVSFIWIAFTCIPKGKVSLVPYQCNHSEVRFVIKLLSMGIQSNMLEISIMRI